MLKIENLNFSYDHEPILTDISFQAEEGRITSVIGPNGTGKTTMLLCVSRLMPFVGKISLDEMSLDSLPREKLSSILSYLSQDTSCSAELSVYEVILLGLVNKLSFRVSVEDQRKVESVMELLGITEFANRKITELSGGQRQLVFIAQTLVKEPKILILDEPTSALDLNRQFKLMNMIKRITIEKKLITLVTLHHLDIAAKYSDRVITLDKGKVYSVGSPEETYTEEMFRYVFGIESEIYRDNTGALHVIALQNIHE